MRFWKPLRIQTRKTWNYYKSHCHTCSIVIFIGLWICSIMVSVCMRPIATSNQAWRLNHRTSTAWSSTTTTNSTARMAGRSTSSRCQPGCQRETQASRCPTTYDVKHCQKIFKPNIVALCWEIRVFCPFQGDGHNPRFTGISFVIITIFCHSFTMGQSILTRCLWKFLTRMSAAPSFSSEILLNTSSPRQG